MLYRWRTVSDVLKDLGATTFRVKYCNEECLPIDVYIARSEVLIVVLLKILSLLECYTVSFGKHFLMF
jgi:hypothetical protein